MATEILKRKELHHSRDIVVDFHGISHLLSIITVRPVWRSAPSFSEEYEKKPIIETFMTTSQTFNGDLHGLFTTCAISSDH